MTRAKLSYLRSIVAGPARLAREDRLEREANAVATKETRRLKAEFERQNALDPLELAIIDAKRATEQAAEEKRNRIGREVVSDIYLTSSQIAGRKPSPRRE